MVQITKQKHGFFYDAFGFKSPAKIYAFLVFFLIVSWIVTYCIFNYLGKPIIGKDLFSQIFEGLMFSFLVLVGVSKAEIFSGAFKNLIDKN